jgi:uncharacterized membrane-anchored protein YhcB (DUF1043 family)
MQQPGIHKQRITGEKPMFTMESSTAIWLIGCLSFAIGLLLGCIAAYLFIGRNDRTRELQTELDDLNQMLTDYRGQVTRHFMHTSELVQEMTQSYRAVYEHLAAGAQHLCSDELEPSQVGFRQTDRVTDDSEDTTTDDIIAELSERADYLEELIGDAPRISDLDIKAAEEDKQRIQH